MKNNNKQRSNKKKTGSKPKGAKRPLRPARSIRPSSTARQEGLTIANEMMASAPKLTMRDMKQFDTVRTSTWHMHGFNANPGCDSMFPWLSKIARQFDQFVTRRLIFHYKTSCDKTQSGTVGMFFDYDVADDNSGIDSAQLSTMSRAVVGAVHQNHTLVVDIAQLLDRRHRTFITSDEKTTDPLRSLGRFWYGVDAPLVSASATVPQKDLGTMWVEFDFDLVNPEAVAPTASGALTLGNARDATGNGVFGAVGSAATMKVSEALALLANLNPKELIAHGEAAMGAWQTISKGMAYIPKPAEETLGLTLPQVYDAGEIMHDDIPDDAGLLVITGRPPGSLIQIDTFLKTGEYAADDIAAGHLLKLIHTYSSETMDSVLVEDENTYKTPTGLAGANIWCTRRIYRTKTRGPHVVWPRLWDQTALTTFAGPFHTTGDSTMRVFDVRDMSGAPYYTDGL